MTEGEKAWSILVDRGNFLEYRFFERNPSVTDFEVWEMKNFNIQKDDYELMDPEDGPMVEGHIKWDGCINFVFPASTKCMIHFCDNPAEKFTTIFNEIYKHQPKGEYPDD